MSAPDRLFAAFADPTRLRILSLLASRKELCVCDLTAVLGRPQAFVSRHLAVLRAAGLAQDRKLGLWRHYSLTAPKGRLHARLLAALPESRAESPDLRRDAARLARRRCVAGACR
ncbi:metalloregulator ArsR/SmtB family transcription factor [bacterium]|nr:MAG: metalloregulator ArsR/SmtB family transcription factor [bacterium]